MFLKGIAVSLLCSLSILGHFSIPVIKYFNKNILREKGSFGSQFKSVVHPGGEVKVGAKGA